MTIGGSVRQLRADMGSTRVYGEPFETGDGSTVITVTRVAGGPFAPTPLGIFVVHNGEAKWVPTRDATRLELFGLAIGMAATVISLLAVLRRPPWPDLSPAGFRAMHKPG
ncbi:hypothetical protein [Nocardia sp. NPDC049149]|uniref:hypothetical protein n=1 Tax=Nocardia sp. NPDC049149 TaxID=3364315 RepID=UPI0037211B5F